MNPRARSAAGNQAECFASTHWSLVLLARQDHSTQSAAALETLCRVYWYPLYGYVRRHGHASPEAQDLTQGFFLHLLQNRGLAAVHPERGRFRSFLLASLKNYLANEWDRSRAQKRGGGISVFSLDEFDPEQRYLTEASEAAAPDNLFDRRWAEAVLEQVMARLRQEYFAAGWGARFDAIKAYLLYESDPGSYCETAAALGVSEGAVKSAIYKLRQRFALSLRQVVAQTVASPTEIEAELHDLFKALTR